LKSCSGLSASKRNDTIPSWLHQRYRGNVFGLGYGI